MITMEELLKGKKLSDLPQEHQDNLVVLLEKLNKIRQLYGKPMTVTSGYRSLLEHLRIYKDKGITDKSKIPMKSRHLFGFACDISDPKQELQAWFKANEKALIEIGVWMESFEYTKNWIHIQTVPPASGKRYFNP